MSGAGRLPADLRARTPPEVLSLLDALLAENAQLRRRVAELERRLRQDSQNSSRPPSADGPAARARRPRRKPSGRRPGGQPGHPFADRPLLPAADVTEVVVCRPPRCRRCRTPLAGDDPDPYIHQVTDLPPVRAETREYRLHTLTCRACGADTTAGLPAGVPERAFGPRLQALAACCVGLYRLSKRSTQELLRDAFGVSVSLGAIAVLERATSQALAAPAAEALDYVRRQPAAFADETGWRQGNGPRKGWLWTVGTALVTVFAIRPCRGAAVIRGLLGPAFAGVLHTDRWSAYHWLDPARRQLCWAHLRREWLAFQERGGLSREVGRALAGLTDRLFRAWHARGGPDPPLWVLLEIDQVRHAVGAWLRRGLDCRHPQTRATCADVLRHEGSLWTFARRPGVEPTNNRAERALRHWVLWRKANLGTQNAAGSEYMARLMTAVTTLRQQGRNVLDWLTAACATPTRGTAPPSLLPTATALPATG